jgi:hypothetical protein
MRTNNRKAVLVSCHCHHTRPVQHNLDRSIHVYSCSKKIEDVRLYQALQHSLADILHIAFSRDDDGAVSSEESHGDERMASLLRDINKRPLVLGSGSQRQGTRGGGGGGGGGGGHGAGERWEVTAYHIRIANLARAWPPFLQAEQERKRSDGGIETRSSHCPSRSEHGRGVDAARALRVAGRLGDCLWEDACCGEIAATLLEERHPCVGTAPGPEDLTATGVGVGNPSGGGLESEGGTGVAFLRAAAGCECDLPIMRSLMEELSKAAASAYLQGS